MLKHLTKGHILTMSLSIEIGLEVGSARVLENHFNFDPGKEQDPGSCLWM